MTPPRKLIAAVAVAALALAGCGDKKAASPSAPAPSARGSDPAERLPSVASELGGYRAIDFGQPLDERGMAAYRETFMRAAAAAPNLDPKTFPYVASEAAGRETDSFKREDVAKADAAAIGALRAAPLPKLEIRKASNHSGVYVNVSPYDMDAGAYTVSVSGSPTMIGYAWREGSHESSYSLRVAAPTLRCAGPEAGLNPCWQDVVKKIPKDQARAIEAELAPMRDASSHTAHVPAGLYAHVAALQDNARWDDALLELSLDAIAVYAMDKPADKPLFVIDGPDLAPKR